MKPWSNRHSLLAGLALLVLANAIVLLGVAYNRSAASDALLHLSERELRLPAAEWGSMTENSAISLQLQWQIPRPQPKSSGLPAASAFTTPRLGGAAAWLDASKLRALGFDVSGPADTPAAQRRAAKQLPKEVLLVIEFDGPAYQAALAAAREEAAQSAAKLATDPENRALKNAAGSAQGRLDYAEHGASRLFIVDAGLDFAALRARYAEGSHYAIVRGSIAIGSRAEGRVSDVRIDTIHVPTEFRSLFEAMPRNYWYPGQRGSHAQYRVTVAYGRRLEPWISALSPEPAANLTR